MNGNNEEAREDEMESAGKLGRLARDLIYSSTLLVTTYFNFF